MIDESCLEPIVSIAMLTYNHEEYIGQAIESVLMQQTNFEFKLIIAEDCSTDKTREIIIEYQKKFPNRIKLILQNINVGANINNKDLLTSLEGKYVAALEGDDYWIDPLKLQKQVDFLENNPVYGLVHTNNKVFLQSQNQFQLDKREVTAEENLFERLIFDSNPIATLTVCMRRNILLEFLKEVEEKGNTILISDYPIWVYFSSKSKIKYLDEVTAVYRVLQESASQSSNPQKKIAFIENQRKQALFFLPQERAIEYDLAFYKKHSFTFRRFAEIQKKKYIRKLFFNNRKYLDYIVFGLHGFVENRHILIRMIHKLQNRITY